ncbi:hypothetical protein J2X20_003397 [Pelomonas saccharophila]|uniref:Solute-binding protein family 3/N-terminal domain-containing protein n=1 Tax=Roseateles saccharophilus TaxID=304 RepID=A0ABU1YPF0_ROSSA|nr:hypothetical protein [Roseateles saccharophilus]MDR7270739.1 hypothetical protein [Roseateles saccharophilus]
MLRRHLAAWAAGLLPWAGFATAAPAAEPLRLVVSPAASARGNEIADAAIALLMRQAGLSYTLSREPVERAVASFRAGLYDADMLRLPQFDQVVPGALRVDPHLLSTTVMAFSRSASLAPTSWAELGSARVAHVRGIKAMELALAGRSGVEITSTAEACLGMVAMQRVDLCLLNAERDFGPPPQVNGVTLHRSVLARVNLHVWVAPGREALAQKLSAAMKAIVAGGELERVAGGNRAP